MKTIHLSLRNLSINEMIRFVVLYVWKTISGPNSISFSSLQSMISTIIRFIFYSNHVPGQKEVQRERHFLSPVVM